MIIKLYEEFAIDDDISLSDFLYLNLKEVDVVVNHGKSDIDATDMDIQSFVDEYIETAERNKQWIGGPLNREWAKKWQQYFGLSKPYTDWKPTIDLKLRFEDESVFIVGFNIMSKQSSKINWGDSEAGSMGIQFYFRLNGNKFGKNWGQYNYDDYYDIIHRIFPEYRFNWIGKPDSDSN